jgi:hypothetical protein
MVKPTPLERKLLRVLLGLLLTVITLALVLPSLLVAWPPQHLERRSQREKVREWVKMAGGWDAIRRDCVSWAEQHTNGFSSHWHDTNGLSLTLVALKPLLVLYEPTPGRVSMKVFGAHSTGGHSTPYFGLEVLTTSKSEAYRPGVGYWGGGVIGNYHSTYKEVAEGIYEIY